MPNFDSEHGPFCQRMPQKACLQARAQFNTFMSKMLYPSCLVLVGSKNMFELICISRTASVTIEIN